MDIEKPRTKAGKLARATLNDEQWAERVARAREQVLAVERYLKARRRSSKPDRELMAMLFPDTHRSTILHQLRNYGKKRGEPWERLLDTRLPPKRPQIPEEVAAAACALRIRDPRINVEMAQQLLRKQFGET